MSNNSRYKVTLQRRDDIDRRAAVAAGMALATLLGVAVVAAVSPAPAHAASVADSFARHAAGSTATVDHSAWDRLLEAHVKPGSDGLNRVAYASWKKDGHAALKAYVADLQRVDVARLDRPEQFAFWANLYNARTIDIVLDKYPVKSIKDINLGGGLKSLVTGGPWQAKVVKVGGQDLSLDDIEHGIMRPIFKDPRVHYAVNCASVGCPNLMTEAFTGARLEALLDTGARAFVNHPRGVRVAGGKVTASSIYSWFQVDFGGSAEGVLAHVRRYAGRELAKSLVGVSTIADYDYDWTLNDVPG
jgi:hypothetical protein